MKAACPSCGAEIEFRYDDSFVRVCEYCRAAVQRTDRGLDSLGKFADLVPMDSPLRLFSDGQMGSQTFILVGMAQLRQEAGGITQEWYAKFSNTWGWLAEAQGRYYLTFEVEGAQLPPLGSLQAGAKVQLPTMLGAMREFTVAEVSSATYVAANGELPFRLAPGTTYRYADLSDGQGNFATIDYGEGSDAPTLYTGQQLSLQDLNISGGEVGPSTAKKVGASRLGCPNCNAPVDVFAAGQSQRAVCGHCNTLLDIQSGTGQVIEKLKTKAAPRIPLGSSGTFPEGKLRVIGYVQRSANIEGVWYPFDEYLLYEPSIGFRWLVQSDGHWSYVQPVDIGAIDYAGAKVKYDGVKFRMFQRSELRVDCVLGEFYWQVKVGETTFGEDYIAPPAMLSKEATNKEENWSLSTYMKTAQIAAAFGDRADVEVGRTIGVGANQPDPAASATTPLAIAFLAMIILGIVFASKAEKVERMSQTVSIPAGVILPTPEGTPPDPNAPNIFFSQPFDLAADQNIEVGFNASLNNNWAYVIASLVNTSTGDLVTLDGSMEYYSGVDGGESWSEGKPTDVEVVGPMPAGQYVLRLETQQGGTVGDVPLFIRVRQGVFRFRYWALGMGVLSIPLFIFGLISYSHEKRRWSNSTEESGPPKTPLVLLVMGIFGIFWLLWALLRVFASSNNDD
ncbi:MAG TPA: DUF4178 domain-containing protein [Kofleriaceae bacterium]|nr:DUF4178 domain-containing protein [Kofleriaceae bacterium]